MNSFLSRLGGAGGEKKNPEVNKEGSCFPESQNMLANFAFPFKGVLEQNQETQRPAGFTLQRGEKKRNSAERGASHK